MGFTFMFAIFMSWFVYFVYSVKMFTGASRLSSLKEAVYPALMSSFPNVFISLLFLVGGRYLFLMSTANVPFFTVPMMFYSYVAFNALIFWVPIMSFGLYRDFKGMVSHMLPYGAPMGLMLFLPLVEIFSQIIRPLTLTIRFGTNLSAGHIMMFMFSYFSMLSSALAPFLYIVLTVLLLMEVFIAFLQAYIFMTLLGLYLDETL